MLVPLGTTIGFPIQVTNSSRLPSTPDAAPTWRIYGPNGGAALLSGVAASSDTDSQTGLRWVTGVAVTTGNGFASGNTYFIRSDYLLSSAELCDITEFTVT